MVEGEGEGEEDDLEERVGGVVLLEAVVDVGDGTGGEEQGNHGQDSMAGGLPLMEGGEMFMVSMICACTSV